MLLNSLILFIASSRPSLGGTTNLLSSMIFCSTYVVRTTWNDVKDDNELKENVLVQNRDLCDLLLIKTENNNSVLLLVSVRIGKHCNLQICCMEVLCYFILFNFV